MELLEAVRPDDVFYIRPGLTSLVTIDSFHKERLTRKATTLESM